MSISSSRKPAKTVDEAKRKEIYDKFQDIVTDQQPLVFLVTPGLPVCRA